MVSPLRFLEADLYYNQSRIVGADFHNHWRTSSRVNDTDLEVAATKATNEKSLGIGAVIGLVNCEDARFEETVDRARKRKKTIVHSLGNNAVYLPEIGGAMVVKGQQVPTSQGNILFLGVDRDTYIMHDVPVKDRTLIDTLAAGKKVGAIAIIPQPFYRGGIFQTNSGAGINRVLSKQQMAEFVFGYEIHNGAAEFSLPKIAPKHANEKAFDEFDRLGGIREMFPGLHTIVTSDGHSFWEIGSSHMEIPMPLYYTEMDSSKKVVNALEYGIQQSNLRNLRVKKSHSSLGGFSTFLDLAALGVNGVLANKLPGFLGKPFRDMHERTQGRTYKGPNYTPNH